MSSQSVTSARAGRACPEINVSSGLSKPPSSASREQRVPEFLRDVIAPTDLPPIGETA